MAKHGIMNDFATVGDEFPLLDDVGHERNVIDWCALWVWKVTVVVELECSANIAHEGGMVEAEVFDVLA